MPPRPHLRAERRKPLGIRHLPYDPDRPDIDAQALVGEGQLCDFCLRATHENPSVLAHEIECRAAFLPIRLFFDKTGFHRCVSRNVVSDRLVQRAMRCISSVSSPSAPMMTATEFPKNESR